MPPLQLDWRICLPACLMFFALQLDRGNITQALSDNMLGEFTTMTFDHLSIHETDCHLLQLISK